MPVEDDTAEVVVVPPPASSASEVVSEPLAALGSAATESGAMFGSPGPVAPIGGVGPTGTVIVGRQVRRKERRERQRIAVICGLVVVVCLAITVFILGMARDRPSRTNSVGSSGVIIPSAALASFAPVDQNSLIPGALAPEGGHR